MNKKKIILVVVIVAIIVIASLYFVFLSTSNKKPVVFEMNDEEDTLTVIEVNSPDLCWKNITLWHSFDGSAQIPDCRIAEGGNTAVNSGVLMWTLSEQEQDDLFRNATFNPKIKVGDEIRYCQDNIALYIENTGELLGNWTFSYEENPLFTLYEDTYEKTITVKTLDPFNEYLWNDVGFRTFGNFSFEFPSGYMDVGDELINLSGEGSGSFYWKASMEGIGGTGISYTEYSPGLKFEQDEENNSLKVISAKNVYNTSWSDMNIIVWPENVTIDKPTGIIKVGDEIVITSCGDGCEEQIFSDFDIGIDVWYWTDTGREIYGHWYFTYP